MHTQNLGKVSETIVLVAGLILFIALIYVIFPALSPVLLLAAILFLLYPVRQHLYIRRIMWLSVLLFVAWFFNILVGVLTPFFLAFVLAYLFNPAVNYLERRSIRRWISSLVIMFVLLGSVVTGFILLVPVIVDQFSNIIGSITQFVKDTVVYAQSPEFGSSLARYGFPVGQIQQIITQEIPSRIEQVLKAVLDGALGFFTSITSIVGHVIEMIIIPFVAFYLLKDFPLIMSRIRELVPGERRDSVSEYFIKVDAMLGQYIRGILLVALIQGIGVTLGLMIIGVQNALVLGIMSGILNLIPFVGFYFSLVVSAIIALLSGGAVATKVILVVVLYFGLNIFENTVLAPRIVGSRVGMHPVILILSLVVFGYFLGFVGLLIAVPVTAVIILSFGMWEEHKRRSASVSGEIET